MDNLEHGNPHLKAVQPIVLDESNQEVVRLGYTEESLRKIEEEYLALTVKDHDDHTNYELAKAAHIRLKSLTSELENTKKTITKEYRDKTQYVNGIANKIKARLEGVKKHLAEQRAVKEDHEKRIKEERERAESERLERMRVSFAEYGADMPLFILASMDDATYARELDAAKVAHEKKLKEDAAEQALRDSLAKENAALRDKLREAQKEERLEAIKEQFPTLEQAWAEIYRLETEAF